MLCILCFVMVLLGGVRACVFHHDPWCVGLGMLCCIITLDVSCDSGCFVVLGGWC